MTVVAEVSADNARGSPSRYASLTSVLTNRLQLGNAAPRFAVVSTAGMLASFGTAVLVANHFDQKVDLVILAIALAVTLARTEHTRASPSIVLTAGVLAAAAAAASGVGELMARDNAWGDVLFTLVMGCSIWVRRWGRGWSKAGAVTALPFVAALVMPFPRAGGWQGAAWSAGIAVMVVGWVTAVLWTAYRIGVLTKPATVPRPPAAAAGAASASGTATTTAAPAATPAATPAGTPAATSARTAVGRRRVSATTRMAVQMSAALGSAFVVGRHFDADHWAWPVLTAFIVCSGNQGRADVVHKGLLRAAGAAAGTAAATGLADQFPPGDKISVVIIFAVLGVATWLRPANYAYWAACLTAAVALMYGYFGQSGEGLLPQRLEGILIGAVLGISASWFILPVRATDVVRKRTAALLAATGALLSSARDAAPAVRKQHAADVVAGVAALNHLAGPLRLHRALEPWRPAARWPADVIDATAPCSTAARTVVRQSIAHPAAVIEPSVEALSAVALANIAAVRTSLGPRPAANPRPLLPSAAVLTAAVLTDEADPAADGNATPGLSDLRAAISTLNDAVVAIGDSVSRGLHRRGRASRTGTGRHRPVSGSRAPRRTDGARGRHAAR